MEPLDILGIVIAVIAGGVLTWFVTRRYYHKDRKESHDDMQFLVDKITENMVDAINAGERIRQKGGRVKYRVDKTLGADHIKSKDEKIDTSENIVAVIENKDREKKIVSEHEIKHSTDTLIGSTKKRVISEHKKEFTIDAVLVEQDKEEENEKQES